MNEEFRTAQYRPYFSAAKKIILHLKSCKLYKCETYKNIWHSVLLSVFPSHFLLCLWLRELCTAVDSIIHSDPFCEEITNFHMTQTIKGIDSWPWRYGLKWKYRTNDYFSRNCLFLFLFFSLIVLRDLYICKVCVCGQYSLELNGE